MITLGIYNHLVLEQNKKDFEKVPADIKYSEYEKYVRNSDMFFYSPMLDNYFTLEDIISMAPDIALTVRLATPEETKNIKTNFNALTQRFFVDNE